MPVLSCLEAELKIFFGGTYKSNYNSQSFKKKLQFSISDHQGFMVHTKLRLPGLAPGPGV